MNTAKSQCATPHVQPDCPLSGEMQRGGAANEAAWARRWSDPARYLGFTAPYNADVSWGKLTVLYLIRHGDLTKIGIANDLARRLKELQAGNPEGLQVVAYRSVPRPLARQIERRMHEHFAHLAIGREWFRGLDVRDALRVAANHVRHAKIAIGRWEADGFALWLP